MLSRLPLQVRSVTSDSNSVLVEDVNRGGRETLGNSSRRQDPETVEHEHSSESCGSVERPDSNTSLKNGSARRTGYGRDNTHDDPLLLPKGASAIVSYRLNG
jgi:hypothetical protein